MRILSSETARYRKGLSLLVALWGAPSDIYICNIKYTVCNICGSFFYIHTLQLIYLFDCFLVDVEFYSSRLIDNIVTVGFTGTIEHLGNYLLDLSITS